MGKTSIERGVRWALVGLRVLIGWHFFYEGITKLLMPGWSSAGYLENSRWLLSGWFHAIAADPTMLRAVDWLNMMGLTLIGVCLVIGLFTRFAALMGMALIGLYYVANPALIGWNYGMPVEGSYFLVDKNLVEFGGLMVLAMFPTAGLQGLDGLLHYLWRRRREAVQPEPAAVAAEAGAGMAPAHADHCIGRRAALLDLATIPVLGVAAYGALKQRQLDQVSGMTGATIKVSTSGLDDLAGTLPKGRIGEFEISRLIMGGNLIGGWSHARDLIYVSSLFKAYNTEQKVFDTLQLGEAAGINAMNITFTQFPLIKKYKRLYGSNLITISQVHPTPDDIHGNIDQAIDSGVDLIQIQGNCCDFRVREQRIDVLAEAMDYIRAQGYPAGLGAHSVQALMACDEAGIEPDFYMKTLHHDRYWSAHPRANRIPFSVDGARSSNHDEFHDNMFCLFPEETIAFLEKKAIPVIGFKVLAGGAIAPEDGFRFAYENGADFICVGMFDFQVIDDTNIAIRVLEGLGERRRPWCA